MKETNVAWKSSFCIFSADSVVKIFVFFFCCCWCCFVYGWGGFISLVSFLRTWEDVQKAFMRRFMRSHTESKAWLLADLREGRARGSPAASAVEVQDPLHQCAAVWGTPCHCQVMKEFDWPGWFWECTQVQPVVPTNWLDSGSYSRNVRWGLEGYSFHKRKDNWKNTPVSV